MERLTKASGTKAKIIVATTGITPREMAHEDDHDHGKDKKGGKKEAHGHDHGATDPHAWQSIANGKIYVANIRGALIAADPAGKDAYTANAAAYTARLDALDAEVKAALAVPADQRRHHLARCLRLFRRRLRRGVDLARGRLHRERGLRQGSWRASSARSKAEKIPAVFLEDVTNPRASSSASPRRPAPRSAASSIPTRSPMTKARRAPTSS